MSVTALTFRFSGNMPSLIPFPKKMSDLLNRNFFLFNLKARLLYRFKNFNSILQFRKSFTPNDRIDLAVAALSIILSWLLEHLQCFLTFEIYFGKYPLPGECHVAYTKNNNDHWGS